MKRTFFVIAVVAQFAGSALLAQTAETTTTETTTGMATGTFGSDWSPSMGTAMMGDDGVTLRSADEIGTQFDTMSAADKDMLRRDCMMHMQTSGAADTSTSSDTTAGTAQTGTDDQAAVAGDAATTDGTQGSMTMSITAEQMDQICAATQDM